MATRERPADRGRRRAAGALTRLRNDLRLARIGAGISHREVAHAIGASHAMVGRFERGEIANPPIVFLGAYCEVVGLEFGMRAYPTGDPIRDRAHLALLERLRVRIAPALRWRTEVPLPIEGDRRAWDAEIAGRGPPPWRVRVEAETNIADGQALERCLALKVRDDPTGHVILLIADTRSNRRRIESLREGLRGFLPLDSRPLLAALGAGRDPAANGIVIL